MVQFRMDVSTARWLIFGPGVAGLCFVAFLVHRIMKNDYRDSVAIAFSFSGRNLEVAMALGATLFGAGSLTAMATVAGPVIGIPMWIIILNLGRKIIYPKLATVQAAREAGREAGATPA